jgi:hypothetical protein
MKSKISINLDSELLNIIRDCSDKDIDSIVQDALAQFFGVKQIWIKTNTLNPICVPTKEEKKDEIINEDSKISTTNTVVNSTTPVIKRRRKPKFVLKIWDKIQKELGPEFTADDYWDATKISGFEYKDSARHSTILEHLKLIEEAGEIEKIGERPKRYRKLEKNEESQKTEEPSQSSEQKKEDPELLEAKQSMPKLFEDV